MRLLLKQLTILGTVMNNKPLFTSEVLFPENLNLILREFIEIKEDKRNNIIEEIRKSLQLKYEEENHPFLSANMSIREINNSFKRLTNPSSLEILPSTRNSSLFDGGIKYSSHSCRGINHWFPEMANAKRANGKSIRDQFNDMLTFRKNVNAICNGRFDFLQKEPDIKLLDALKKGLRLINGNQPIYNFSALVAKNIYFDFFKRHPEIKNNFFILDPSMGFGGRLVGAMALGSNPGMQNIMIHYYGTDVNTTISDRYAMLHSYWLENINPSLQFDLCTSIQPAEDLLEEKVFSQKQGCFDIAMTSPPYFSTERYSDDLNQSYKKFPYYDKGFHKSWKKGFLEKMLLSTHSLLRKGGEAWINIANIHNRDNFGKFNDIFLEDDTVSLAQKIGFKYIKKYILLMPLLCNLKNITYRNMGNKIIVNDKSYKQEPILVFLK